MTPHRVLIPATPQRLWGPLAVANFVLGGLGAGFYLAAALGGGLRSTPALALASWLGPALVVAGLVAVATVAGRPLRGVRVIARARTSWMSREALLAAAFVGLASAERMTDALRGPAAAAALAFVLAQGFLVRRARGVTAWDVPILPAVFLTSALLSGCGLLLLTESAAGRGAEPVVLATTLVLIPVGMLTWLAYLTWSTEPAFTDAVRPLSHGRGAVVINALAYLAPFVLLLVALVLAWPAAAAVAGALSMAGHTVARWRLILDAGALRPITLSTLRLSRRLS
jgi:DMSO reductase anchor subunit